jgi:hypothetical protein
MTTDLINNRTAERHDFLWGTFVTALESGVGYWCRINSYRPGWAPDMGERTDGQVRDYDNFRAEIECEYDCYLVDADVIEKGIEALKNGEAKVNSTILGWIVEGDNENDAGNIDATAADCIVQAGLFGEVVYG